PTLTWPSHKLRLAFANLLLATEAYQRDAARLKQHHLAALELLGESGGFDVVVACLLRAIRKGIGTDYLFAGMQVAEACRSDQPLWSVQRGQNFPSRAVTTLAEHLRQAPNWNSWLLMQLWQR